MSSSGRPPEPSIQTISERSHPYLASAVVSIPCSKFGRPRISFQQVASVRRPQHTPRRSPTTSGLFKTTTMTRTRGRRQARAMYRPRQHGTGRGRGVGCLYAATPSPPIRRRHTSPGVHPGASSPVGGSAS